MKSQPVRLLSSKLGWPGHFGLSQVILITVTSANPICISSLWWLLLIRLLVEIPDLHLESLHGLCCLCRIKDGDHLTGNLTDDLPVSISFDGYRLDKKLE